MTHGGLERDPRPLYERIMRHSWTQIAEPVRRLHATRSGVRARGHLRVVHGDGYVAWMIGRILRLPRPSDGAQTRLTVTPRGTGERWLRNFNGRCLETWQYESTRGELADRFGLLELRFRLDAREGSLHYIQREAAVQAGGLRVVIPAAWAPRVEAREGPAGPDRIEVMVRVTLPWAGQLIAYGGIIEIEAHGRWARW